MRWLRWVNANASVIVLEYSPTHFPASPMGEFEHWRSRAARTRAEHHPRRGGSSRGGGEDNGDDDGGMGCAPHQRSLGTSALEKGRRDAGVGLRRHMGCLCCARGLVACVRMTTIQASWKAVPKAAQIQKHG